MEKIFLLIVYMFMVPVCLGYLAEVIADGQVKDRIGVFWKGFLCEIAVFFLVWRITMVLEGDFALICKIYNLALALLVLSAAGMLLIRIRKPVKREYRKDFDKNILFFGVLFVLLLGFQIIRGGYVFETYPTDRTALYVSTIVGDQSLFLNDPFTGLPYTGLMERVYYNGQTVFFAFLTDALKVRTVTLVYKMIPVWVLLIFYSFLCSMGYELFGKKKYAILYVIAIAVLNIFGTGRDWVLSPYLLLYSWTDNAMQACIFLPILVWQALKWILKKNKKSDMVLLIADILVLINYEMEFYVVVLILVSMCLLILKRILKHEGNDRIFNNDIT